jgi:hypothetical protein
MPIKCCEGFNQQIYPQVDSWKKRSVISRLREISRLDRQAGMHRDAAHKVPVSLSDLGVRERNSGSKKAGESEHRF